MRTIIEVLRLKYDAGLSHEKIARACGLSKGVVSKYVSLAQVAGISWPLPYGTDEAALEARLFPTKASPSRFAAPEYFRFYSNKHGIRSYAWDRLHSCCLTLPSIWALLPLVCEIQSTSRSFEGEPIEAPLSLRPVGRSEDRSQPPRDGTRPGAGEQAWLCSHFGILATR